MKAKEKLFEQGQSIVLVTIMFLGLVAMLALVLDGGNIFTQRRIAQLAADAGALAGARHLCGNEPDFTAAQTDAFEYAVNHNEAQDAIITFPQAGAIQVETAIDFVPFFAQVIGFDNFSVSATAVARCDTPSVGNVLPIAWSCPPPLPDEEGNLPEDQLCAYQYNECEAGDEDCEVPLYVFMDSDDQDCIFPPNTYGTSDYISGDVDCDWDDDGLDDAFVGQSNRGWLDLNDGTNSSTSDLREKIVDACVNGIGSDLTDHTWVAGQPGVTAPTFDAIKEFCTDRQVIIPVFDVPCINTGDPERDCVFDPPHNDDYITRTGTGNYYHIVGFASLTITCVHSGPSDRGDRVYFGPRDWEWGSVCPGRNLLQLDNPGTFGPSSPMTIEGYLNFQISPDVSGFGGMDSGTYVIYLVE